VINMKGTSLSKKAKDCEEEEALKALEGSIMKWDAVCRGHGIDHGATNCPLCVYHDYLGAGNCNTCVVQISTGIAGCQCSPYEKWEAISGKLDSFEQVGKSQLPNYIKKFGIEECSDLIEAAEAEVELLCSLLPDHHRFNEEYEETELMMKKMIKIEALEGSIMKWDAICMGYGADLSAKNCTLCHAAGIGCSSCIVYEATGLSDCQGTPYVAWCEAWRGFGAQTNKPFGENEVLSNYMKQRFAEAAESEMEFLCSLLPEDHKWRKEYKDTKELVMFKVGDVVVILDSSYNMSLLSGQQRLINRAVEGKRKRKFIIVDRGDFPTHSPIQKPGLHKNDCMLVAEDNGDIVFLKASEEQLTRWSPKIDTSTMEYSISMLGSRWRHAEADATLVFCQVGPGSFIFMCEETYDRWEEPSNSFYEAIKVIGVGKLKRLVEKP
jgi:hypothetical protein